MRTRERKQQNPSAPRPARTDVEWLRHNSGAITRRYSQKWIAVYHGSVVASGDNPDLVRQQASMIVGHERFLMTHVEKGMVIL